jgi:hypothetical protein
MNGAGHSLFQEELRLGQSQVLTDILRKHPPFGVLLVQRRCARLVKRCHGVKPAMHGSLACSAHPFGTQGIPERELAFDGEPDRAAKYADSRVEVGQAGSERGDGQALG